MVKLIESVLSSLGITHVSANHGSGQGAYVPEEEAQNAVTQLSRRGHNPRTVGDSVNGWQKISTTIDKDEWDLVRRGR